MAKFDILREDLEVTDVLYETFYKKYGIDITSLENNIAKVLIDFESKGASFALMQLISKLQFEQNENQADLILKEA